MQQNRETLQQKASLEQEKLIAEKLEELDEQTDDHVCRRLFNLFIICNKIYKYLF